jgi:dipeptidyl aminopeptidase/acylaminoacyl peptidase
VALAVGASRGLAEVRPDGGDLYVLESRPEEAGRVALLRLTGDGVVTDVAPDLSVRSRVHEYGGGAYAVRDGRIVLTDFPDGRLLTMDAPDEPLRELVVHPQLRFADMEIDPARGRVLAVLEDRRDSELLPRNLLCAVALADGALRELVTDHDFVSDPRLSPDGSVLAWLTWDFPNMPWDGTDLWVARIAEDGGLQDPVHVAGGLAESIVQPRWAPDGSLVFVSDRSGWWNLERWSHEARTPAPLLPMAAEFSGPQWVFGLSDLDVDGDGTIVATASSEGRQRLYALAPGQAAQEVRVPVDRIDDVRVQNGVVTLVGAASDQPAAILRFDLASGLAERVRASGPMVVDPTELSRPQHVSFPSTEGRTAHAWYYPPTSTRAVGPTDERPPLVVMSHGGPTAQASPTLSYARQVFTSRGIAVVDVDYGGSTGYGRAYRELLHERWGIVDVEDCTAAARYLVDQGLADPRRLAIRGGSAGGYTTLATLCFTDAFGAGVSYYGIGDLESFAAVTHKFESQYDVWLVGPRADQQRYRDRSPNSHADRISCPVLVIQGSEDRIVPPSEAEGIVAALARNGLPHAYLLFEGEGHGLRKAENQRRALEAELSFYAQVFGFELADDFAPLEVTGLAD